MTDQTKVDQTEIDEIDLPEPQSLLTAGWVAGEHDPAPVHIDFRPVLKLLAGLTDYELDDWWVEFNRANRDVMGKLELNSEGALLVSPYPGWDGAKAEGDFAMDLRKWSESYGGESYGARLGIRLPNGARYVADGSWASAAQLAEHKPPGNHILLFCPAFVLEVRARNDGLRTLRLKMAEYIANGAQLGWLIDPYSQQVHIYRPGMEVEVLDDPETISGESVLPGFTFDVRGRIFHLY